MEAELKNQTITLDQDPDLSSDTPSEEFRCRMGSDAMSTMTLHEVLDAYAGLARPGKYYAPSRNLPSMAPVGLLGFGVASMFMGMLLAEVRGITIPNYTVVGAWFIGGIGLLTAGMWEFLLENSHGSAVMVTYGLYWWSAASIYTPSFGIGETFVGYCTANVSKMPEHYSTPLEWGTAMMGQAVGMWTLAFAFFSFTVVATLVKSTVAFLICIFLVSMIFLCITIGYLGETILMVKVAGWFSFAAGIMAIYNGMAGLMTVENSYIHLKPIHLPKPNSVPVPDPEK